MKILRSGQGFTLIEMMVVVVVIGILAAFAYPSYQDYVIRTKRAEMMSEMQNIAKQIESQKLAQGSYKKVDIAKVTNGTYNSSTGKAKYPSTNNYLYDVEITPINTTKTQLSDSSWKIEASPTSSGSQASDGSLTLDYMGRKCRGTSCGMGNEWKD
ncbi:type IV pilin protein [Psychrobacter sp. I-STPA6b]|uniref:type IV pilin protein n=1 Tax=Psychrobacter sp. I-STPA6b TaxID=2585718 RepID=UPI0029CAB6A7|nr:type IV pilin protein [Psychrobacter sp. I-STPA6b]